jgi:quercetin dioxygenase-like cupin family protein
MHVTRKVEGRLERSEGWGTQRFVRLTWLIDRELGGCEHGAVGRMTIDPGGFQPLHRHPGAEEVTVVLSGSGTALCAGEEVPFRAGNVLHAPAGAAHGVAAGGERLDLLVVASAPGAAAAGWEEGAGGGPSARLLSGGEADEQELDDPETGFVGMHARRLVDAGICDSDSLVIGASRFVPGIGTHELHRHPGAAEFFVLLEGDGAHLDLRGGQVPVAPGDAALLGASAWHGFRNTGPREARAISGFLGSASFDAAGYELPVS